MKTVPTMRGPRPAAPPSAPGIRFYPCTELEDGGQELQSHLLHRALRLRPASLPESSVVPDGRGSLINHTPALMN